MRQLAIAGVIMLALDAIYLGVTRGFWDNVVRSVQDSKLELRVLSAAAVYVVMLLGLNYFVLEKGANPIDGLLFGIVIYGVYDLTNHAIFTGWPLEAIYLDTVWGGLLMMITTYLTNKLHRA